HALMRHAPAAKVEARKTKDKRREADNAGKGKASVDKPGGSIVGSQIEPWHRRGSKPAPEKWYHCHRQCKQHRRLIQSDHRRPRSRAARSRASAAISPGKSCEPPRPKNASRSEEHTSELQSRENLVCRLLLEKKKTR